MLEAPYPLPAQAKCPFCAAVFSPAAPQPLEPVAYPPGVQPSPYQPPGAMYPVPAAPSTGRLTAPAVCLLVTGILWMAYATLNWVGTLAQGGNVQVPLPFQGNPDMARGFEIGMKASRFLGPVLIGMGLLITIGAIQMLRRRAWGMALTGSIVALLPCSPCCILALPLGIWSLVVLNRPEVKAMFS
jgi:hypothetical protein